MAFRLLSRIRCRRLTKTRFITACRLTIRRRHLKSMVHMWERPPIRSFGVRALGAVLSGVLLLLAAQALAATPEETGKPGVAVHPTLAVGFIANEGRLDPQVRYYGRGRGYAVYFTPGEVVLSFAPRSSTSRADHVALALHFVGGSPAAALDVRREGIAKVNDLTG